MLSAQSTDFSLAKVGKKIYGIYVFFGCEPANPYTYVKTIDVKVKWSDTYYDSFEKVIDKAKKKEPYFNGIIFQVDNLSKADLIRFDELESSRGGYSFGSKVSFIDNGQIYAGEIVELETSKGNATVKFKNVFFEDELKRLNYEKLTPLSEEIYQEKLGEIEKISERYKFQIGEKVSWISSDILGKNKKQLSGEIVNLDNKLHKASVRYLNPEKKEIISTVPYIDLVKIK